MPGVLAPVSYEPIRAMRVLSSQGNLPAMIRQAEDATQTFKIGVPLMINSGNGCLEEWSTGSANIVYGVSAEPAHNLTTAATAQNLSEGTPQNQTSAITTPVGAWIRDGNIGTYMANGQTVFSIALKATQTFTQSLVLASTLYGLTKDATSGFWYLDTSVTGGNSGVAILIGLDSASPNTSAGGARVFFMFAEAKRYFQ